MKLVQMLLFYYVRSYNNSSAKSNYIFGRKWFVLVAESCDIFERLWIRRIEDSSFGKWNTSRVR